MDNNKLDLKKAKSIKRNTITIFVLLYLSSGIGSAMFILYLFGVLKHPISLLLIPIMGFMLSFLFFMLSVLLSDEDFIKKKYEKKINKL